MLAILADRSGLLFRLVTGQTIQLVPPVIDSAVNLRIDSSAMTEISRDRETDCREEVRRDSQQ